MGDVGPLAHLAEGKDVVGTPADGAPVAPRVFQQLVGLGEPEGAFAPPQPLVEDDGGNLPALAAAGAVAQHPAPPEAHRIGQRLVGVDGLAVVFGSRSGLIAVVIAVGVDALHGLRHECLPAGADAVLGGEVFLVRLAGKDHALELGVGQQPLGHHLLRQHWTVRRHGVGHRRHGARLHQRRRVLDRAGHVDARCPPPRVGAGGLGALGGTAAGRHRLVGELGDRAPVVWFRRMRGGPGTPGPRGPGPSRRCRRLAEQVRAGHGLDGTPRRHGAGERLKKVAGVAHRVAGIDARRLLASPVEDGEAGVEGGAAPRIGAPVDGRREHRKGRRVEGGEGIRPGGIAGDAVRRRNRHQAPTRRQHRASGTDVMQIGVMADAVHAGAGRERRVHQHHGGPELWQPVPDRLRVVAGDGAARKQAGEEARAGGGDLVEVQRVGVLAEGKLRHDGQHAGACRGFEHHVAGADHGGLQRRIGQGQRRRELLVLELLFGAPGLRGLQRRERLQHPQHGGGTAGACAGLAAHGAAVALEEEHQRRLGRLVGVLPEPGAVRVGGAEGGGHGLAHRAGIERAAGLQDGQQGPGRGQQRGGRGGGLRRGGFAGRGGGECGGGRTSGVGRRRVGVEHEQTPCWKGVEPARAGREASLPPRPAGLPPAGWPDSRRREARRRGEGAAQAAGRRGIRSERWVRRSAGRRWPARTV